MDCNQRHFLTGGWTVHLYVDNDNHLNVYILNSDSDIIHQIETGQGDGENEQFALRFTTEEIEQKYEQDFGQ